MPGWLQALILALQLGREIIKLIKKHEQGKKECLDCGYELKAGFKKAREEGDLTDVQKVFRKLKLLSPDELHDG